MISMSWFWLFFILWLHVTNIVGSIYVHRGIGHQMFTFSKGFDHFCRFFLWITKKTGPFYAETYYMRHIRHHAYADSEMDPHSPYFMTWRELLKPWKEDISKFDKSPVKTPQDWIETNLYQPYRKQGAYVGYLIAGLLYGPLGFLIMWIYGEYVERPLNIMIGNWAFHKIGFTYEKNTTKHGKARIIFPLGIFLCGEELHTHHHNDTTKLNFKKYWFELDMGYVYARFFKFLGFLEFQTK